jgi:hypothetical protein
MAIGLEQFGAALAALSALSTAAFGLLDATKALGGGVSNIGLKHIRGALTPFTPALDAAVGGGNWWEIVRSNWLNGVAKAEQKAIVRALLKLGLSPATAGSLAIGARVTEDALKAAAAKLETGKELSEADLNVLGRMTAALDAVLDAAFERAEQQYRNAARAWAGVMALVLALGGWGVWAIHSPTDAPSLWVAIAVGLLAVPVAPVAKDLTSGLSAAMRALKAARAL